MRKKTKKLVTTFHTTTEALKAEALCIAHHVEGRMIPVPREISASCGLAWMSPLEKKEDLWELLKSENIVYEESCEVML